MNHGVADSTATLKKTARCPGARKPRLDPLSSGPFPIEVSRQKTLRVRTTHDWNLFCARDAKLRASCEIHARADSSSGESGWIARAIKSYLLQAAFRRQRELTAECSQAQLNLQLLLYLAMIQRCYALNRNFTD